MTHLETQEHSQDIPTPEQLAMTLEEFLATDVDGYEYVKGELVPMPGTSIRHGKISMNIAYYLYAYVRENQLGRLFTSETSFKVGERALKPDVAFLSAARLVEIEDEDKGSPIPPDLAIEVISPSDIQSRIVGKVFAYLDAGTRVVWIIEPISKTVTVYQSETDIKILTCEDTLTGGEVVPGFSCPVAQLFE